MSNGFSVNVDINKKSYGNQKFRIRDGNFVEIKKGKI